MTASKFQELLETPARSEPRASTSSRETPSTFRFPIDDGPMPSPIPDPIPNPSRNSSRKVLRKLSGSKPAPIPAPSPAFSGPDADFDFGGRERVQRIEPESPTSEQEEKSARRESLGSKGRRRLRKLSIALSGH